ncbi:NAD+ diphosphatase [Aliiruegeria haliotis]|uniref:NAD(+) diphosphatase n=1 Tax=Aliiruegeria haliotis TaxID=1280846 RepID=A0A2T0RPM9_9RHOB|nr:NAD(+) diphosphatase [Aliiruegeria haliotis]PRY23111.1 NAD+ diphosphatase [Aliiruegeria haliotis]
MRIAEQVTFGGGGLERAAELRCDRAALTRMVAEDTARIVPFWKSKPLVVGCDEGGLSLAGLSSGAAALSHATEEPIFLGLADGTPWFAVDISPWEPAGQDTDTIGAFVDLSEQRYPGLPDDHRFAELRTIMNRLSPLDAELAATARGLMAWHQTHGFCARCGHASDMEEAGWQRRCPACDATHFPRTDPVVIMLVTHGNSVLLGRSPGWPDGMYSLLAGFVEPGETIEAAVRRETFEETGVRIGAVEYLASQPWPFPASLMMGCRGVAKDRKIKIDPREIEDAIWVTREEMLQVMAGDHPHIKAARSGAIARFLLTNWLADRLD